VADARVVEDGLRHDTQRAGPHHHQPNTLAQRRRQDQCANEGPGQQCLVLHRLHAADRTDEPVRRGGERGAADRHRSAGRRREAVGIDTVVDLLDALRRNAHPLREVGRQVLRKRHMAVHERRVQAAHALIVAAGAVEVFHVATVFAMDAYRHARRPGAGLHLQRREVARVHDGRTPLPQQAPELGIQLGAMPRRLVQGHALDIVMAQSVPKIRQLRQCQHHVPVSAVWHVVDQVDNTVLQTADVESVDDVQHQWARLHWIQNMK